MRPGRRLWAIGIGIALLGCLGTSAATAGTVYVARISGAINPAVSDYLSTALAEAEANNADALVLELDTPGGLLSSTKDMVTVILNAEIPVIVFVSPRGAWAGSAGTFITLAGHVAAMAPGTTIGAAHPVSMLPGSPPPAEPPAGNDEGADEAGDESGGARSASRDLSGEKIENAAAAFISSIAEERERNVEWAVDAVRNSVAITQSEALEKQVIDLVAEDLDHLLELVHGRQVKVGRHEVELDTEGATRVYLEMGFVNRIFDVISDPNILLLLIFAGMLGLYVEFNNPGMIFPGVAGLLAMILAGLGLQVIPFNWIGLLLILVGVALMAAEVFVSSFGVLFACGIAALAAGGYLVFDVPELEFVEVPFLKVVLPAVAAMAVFGGIVVFSLSRSLFSAQQAGAEGLVGEVGVVDRAIESGIGSVGEIAGRVFLRGELWTAESDQGIPKGSRVRIVSVRDLIVRVAPAADSREEQT